MRGIYKKSMNHRIWMQKTWDLVHGYGWHIQIYSKKFNVGYGFSKNKFTAVRLAFKDLLIQK